jgi:hypothetical protein
MMGKTEVPMFFNALAIFGAIFLSVHLLRVLASLAPSFARKGDPERPRASPMVVESLLVSAILFFLLLAGIVLFNAFAG